MRHFWTRPKFILWTLFLILFTTIVLQNVEPVDIDLLFWSLPQMPKLVLILASMLVGMIVMLLIVWDLRSRRRKGSEVQLP